MNLLRALSWHAVVGVGRTTVTESGGGATARAVRGTAAYPVLLVSTGGCGEMMGVRRGCSGDGGAMRASWHWQW